jgi:hypothetical protein
MRDHTEAPATVKAKRETSEHKSCQLYPDGVQHGFFGATRGPEPKALMKKYPRAFLLAWHIADRTQRASGFNEHGLLPGEALIGDYLEYGFTEQEYRTAKRILEKHGFATFKTTNRGTIAKLSDRRLFAVATETTNEPSNGEPTDSQRTANGQLTTTNRGNKGIREESLTDLKLTSSGEKSKEKPRRIDPVAETDLRAEMIEIFGKEDADEFGGTWTLRWRENVEKYQRVIAEVREMIKTHRIHTTISGTANDLWNRWRPKTNW